jgi:hypothetical protein
MAGTLDYLASPAPKPPLPLATRVTAWVFIVVGLWAAADILRAVADGRISLDFSVLAVGIGWGILHRRRGWHTLGLVSLWLGMLAIGVLLPAVLYEGVTRPSMTSVHFGVAGGTQFYVVSPWLLLPPLGLALAGMVAMYRSLTRTDVRYQFGLAPNVWPLPPAPWTPKRCKVVWASVVACTAVWVTTVALTVRPAPRSLNLSNTHGPSYTLFADPAARVAILGIGPSDGWSKVGDSDGTELSIDFASGVVTHHLYGTPDRLVLMRDTGVVREVDITGKWDAVINAVNAPEPLDALLAMGDASITQAVSALRPPPATQAAPP